MERLRIGLIGWGTVGSALGELVRAGPLPLTLESVAVRNRQRPDLPKGIEVGAPEAALEADIVVELAGGLEGPLTWARLALDRGKPYVTANKALLAAHGGELAELADRRVAALLASASVGGGTPMIETVTHLAATGAIERIRGIVNATTTYILIGHGRRPQLRRRTPRGAGGRLRGGRSELRRGGPRRRAEARHPRPRSRGGSGGRRQRSTPPGSSGSTWPPARPSGWWPKRRRKPCRSSRCPLEPSDPLARAAGIENILEITVADAGTFRVSGPGAGGRVTAGAVYADLGRLVAGERPVLFGSR